MTANCECAEVSVEIRQCWLSWKLKWMSAVWWRWRSPLCCAHSLNIVAKGTINEALVTDIKVLNTVYKLVTCSSTQSFGTRKFTENPTVVGRSEAPVCLPSTFGDVNTLRTGDADLRFYVTTVQDGWRRFAFLTRWNSVHLQVLLSAIPQGGIFPEVSYPQALLGSLVSISWKFQFTKIVSEFVINF